MPLTDPSTLWPLAVVIALLGVCLATLALVSHRRSLRRLLGVFAQPDVRESLSRLAAGIEPLAQRLAVIEEGHRFLQDREPQRVAAPGLVHFQAYGNDGPPLSFSVAILDGHRHGVVLTSLCGRDHVRLYAKPICSGRSTAELAVEESKALDLALSGGGHQVLQADAVPDRPALRSRVSADGGIHQ